MDPIADINRSITLAPLRLSRQQLINDNFMHRVTADVWPDRLVDGLVIKLHTDVYSEQLPSQHHRLNVTDPRWSTWWDHLKATYAQRWWARWWVSRHPARTVDTTIAATFNVRAAWKYPDTPLPRSGLGRPVVWTETRTPYPFTGRAEE